MSLSSQRFSATSPSRFTFLHHSASSARHRLKSPSAFSLPIASRHLAVSPPHLQIFTDTPSSSKPPVSTRSSRLRVHVSEGVVHRNNPYSFNFDSFLSISEFLCLVSSAVLTIVFAANYAVSGWKKGVLGERVLVWGLVTMVGGVLAGALIRRRQWSRVCMESVEGGVESFNLVARIEKLEEDVKSSTTIIRALSRQLEKLGIRFRVTRKSLKDPISETAALARKNSEATRALAAQEDILEKEVGEIHNILLAMQEQQHKQLDLIIAVGKAGKLLNDEKKPKQEHDKKVKSRADEEVKQIDDPKEKPQTDEGLEAMETSPLDPALGKSKKRK